MKTETTRLHLKIQTDLMEEVHRAAKKSRRTLSEFIRDSLAEAVGYDGPQIVRGAPRKDDTDEK